MVTQEAYLFSGTVADNIALGKPDATLDEIQAAARAVGADAFIEALPDGYATDVNKRGGRVSAGQRQLISFARAFLADPAVLILDEATASLDIPSERQIQDALQTLLADRTAIIIAHRLSTVAIADRVLVMEHGRIIEDDAPEELIGGDGRFAQAARRLARVAGLTGARMPRPAPSRGRGIRRLGGARSLRAWSCRTDARPVRSMLPRILRLPRDLRSRCPGTERFTREVRARGDRAGDRALDGEPVVNDLRVGEAQDGVPAEAQLRVVCDVAWRGRADVEWNAKPSICTTSRSPMSTIHWTPGDHDLLPQPQAPRRESHDDDGLEPRVGQIRSPFERTLPRRENVQCTCAQARRPKALRPGSQTPTRREQFPGRGIPRGERACPRCDSTSPYAGAGAIDVVQCGHAVECSAASVGREAQVHTGDRSPRAATTSGVGAADTQARRAPTDAAMTSVGGRRRAGKPHSPDDPHRPVLCCSPHCSG